MFLEVGVASTGVPGYRPVALAPTGVRAEPNLPWRHASGEPRAVRAVGNAADARRRSELQRGQAVAPCVCGVIALGTPPQRRAAYASIYPPTFDRRLSSPLSGFCRRRKAIRRRPTTITRSGALL